MLKSTQTADYVRLRSYLKKMRHAAGLSQRQLGNRLELPHSWVEKVEAGERRIDLVEFGWFCAACGVEPAQGAREYFDARSGGKPLKGAK